MPKATVVDMTGKKVGEVELSEAVFGIEPNQTVVHDVVKNHLANCRQGTQSALTRAEVSGGGRKPWRQKGTGHARQGSTRAPQWTHGGIVFAPKPRDYSYTLNKKVKRLALKSALSAKAQEGNVIVVDGLGMDEIKTKTFQGFLNSVGAGKAMVVTSCPNVVKSARNIPGVVTTSARCPAARHRRARFQVYRSTPPGVGRYWVVKKQKVISRCQRAMTASIMLRMTPHCTSASALVRRAWAEASSGTAARRRGRQVSSRAGSTGRKYRPCRPYRVS